MVDKFSATGEYKGQLTGICASGVCTGEEAFGQIYGVAIDPSGNLWVYEGAGVVAEFSDSGSYVTSFSTGRAAQPTLAVDSKGAVYVVSGGEEVLEFDSATGEQLGEFDPGSRALALNPVTSNLLVDKGNNLELYAPVTETKPQPLQTFAQEGLVESTGIAVSATGTVYASERGADEVESFAFVLTPGIGEESSSQIGEAAEKFVGTVNPEGEAITGCSFEYALYGSQAGVYPQSVPCRQAPAEIGSGNKTVTVSAEVSDLRPGSTYHFRLKASNANGSADGRDETFVVRASPHAPLSLPDDRAYELVSTVAGTEVFPPGVGEDGHLNRKNTAN